MSDVKTVMIVDDSRVARMMIHAIIKEAYPKWTIIEASDGNEALSKTNNTNIDLMILDFNMPGMDGLTLGGELRKQYPDADIALLTANIQESIQIKAKDLGIYFSKKPITQERILGILGIVEV